MPSKSSFHRWATEGSKYRRVLRVRLDKNNNEESWYIQTRRVWLEENSSLDLSLETFTTSSRRSDEVSPFKSDENLIRIPIQDLPGTDATYQ